MRLLLVVPFTALACLGIQAERLNWQVGAAVRLDVKRNDAAGRQIDRLGPAAGQTGDRRFLELSLAGSKAEA